MKSLSSADKRSEAGTEVKELRLELSRVSKGEPGAVTISERVWKSYEKWSFTNKNDISRYFTNIDLEWFGWILLWKKGRNSTVSMAWLFAVVLAIHSQFTWRNIVIRCNQPKWLVSNMGQQSKGWTSRWSQDEFWGFLKGFINGSMIEAPGGPSDHFTASRLGPWKPRVYRWIWWHLFSNPRTENTMDILEDSETESPHLLAITENGPRQTDRQPARQTDRQTHESWVCYQSLWWWNRWKQIKIRPLLELSSVIFSPADLYLLTIPLFCFTWGLDLTLAQAWNCSDVAMQWVYCCPSRQPSHPKNLQGTTSSGVLVIYGALDDPELGPFLEVLGVLEDDGKTRVIT